MKFVEAVTNVFRIPDLRRRIFFTLAMLAVYRVGGHIPTPGVDTDKLSEMFQQAAGTALGLDSRFSIAWAGRSWSSDWRGNIP